jgi:hypothetical protein
MRRLRELKLIWEIWLADRAAARLLREATVAHLVLRTEHQLRLVEAARSTGAIA